ncbi:phenylacetate--CoA ligase family protein [Hallerella porci]|uniref:Phenylacetate-CoA ligase n=1 Tax=Hallerella porci TaxID=1945871 RepID=A0ABX5LI70_9BACT|nr:phenylacetate--CoA ligase family protein [Hallerella porci]PWK93150.1 phenylacetate-CoA ligase [Hallerella porci]
MDLNALYLRTRFWIKDFLKGSPIRKPYNEIKFIQENSYEKGLPIREAALQQLLNFAKQNTTFYKNIQGNDLKSFPIMNKFSLLEHYNEICVEKSKIPGQVGDVHIQTTSGSTGTPFKIPQDTRKRMRRIAELKYFGAIAGFKTHEKLIHLRTWNRWQQKTAKQIKTENIIPFDISKIGDVELKQLCELIISSKAVCLRGYASSLGKLAEYAKDKGYKFPHLKLAIAGAESLQDDVRALFKEVMHADIQSQYANEECGILAQERVPTLEKDNPMYWNNSGYFFEVLKFDSDEPAEYGELGRIVITDLHNYAFPVIRYDNGDTAILQAPNQFSNGYPIIEKLYGRRLDLTYTTTGTAVSPLTYGRILKHYENIAQWQFIQNGEKDYALNLIMRGEEPNLPSIVEMLKESLGRDANIIINKVDDIPILASGKRKPVVNNWQK